MLNCYGENSLTYLLFDHLNETNSLITKLVANLKQFSSNKTFANCHPSLFEDLKSEVSSDVWLFPNFGKGSGFGEPDAILLCGDYSFWFELETNFDLRRKKSSARNSLLQLLRFNYFASALSKGKTRRKTNRSHWAITGATINGKAEFKPAILRMAGHPVLNEIGPRLVNSFKKKKDHYVIFSEKRMNGIKGKAGNKTALRSMFHELVAEHQATFEEAVPAVDVPNKPDEKRFWYEYLNGDLDRKGVSINQGGKKYVQITTA